MSSEIPLVWLCGPPGVGKTAVAWAVFRRLLAGGTRAACVDVDQLGMCFPEPPDDPGRHRLAARNVRGLRRNFAAEGAEA
jgi:molybdopterin-guanine dinucleotide biosynthesis protein